MNEVVERLTDPETAARFKYNGGWNKRIQIPGVWQGPVSDIPVFAVEKLIEQGRKEFVPIPADKVKKPEGK